MLAGIQDLLNFNIHILRSWALTIYDHRILEKPLFAQLLTKLL